MFRKSEMFGNMGNTPYVPVTCLTARGSLGQEAIGTEVILTSLLYNS